MLDKKINPIQEIIKLQIKLCSEDPIYFMKKFVYIQADDGRILFELFDFQEMLLKHFTNPNEKRISIVKSRQMGITTLCAAYALWLILFHSDRKVVSLAPTQEKAKFIVDKVIFAYENLPSWLKSGERSDTEKQKLSLSLNNGSGVRAASGDSNSARGFTAHLLIIDEAATINNAEELWGSAQQTLTTTQGDAIILSTPNGVGNWFYKNHNKAVLRGKDRKPEDFIALKLPWQRNKRRNQAWRDQQTVELGERLAAQECDCDFSTSGATVVPPKIIQWYEKESKWIIEPKHKTGVLSDFWIWKDPEAGRNYVGVADIARGGTDDGSDYSTLHIFDLVANEQVAEYKGKMDTKDFARFLIGQGYMYNNMLLVIERESIGWAVVKDVIEGAYPNIYYSPKEGMVIDANTYLNRNYANDMTKMVPGFSTNVKFRPLVINAFKTAIENKRLIIHSMRTIDEWRTFIYNEAGKATAAKGFNDDLIIPIGIYEFLRDTAFRFAEHSMDLTKQSIESFRIGSAANDLHHVPAVVTNTQTAAISSGKPAPIFNIKNLKVNPYKMRVPGRGDADTSWLL